MFFKKLPLKFLVLIAGILLTLQTTALPATPVAAQEGTGQAILADFEVGVPDGWFVFAGASTVTPTTETVGETDPLARPGQGGDNGILTTTFDISDFGGFGQDFTALGGPQDWSNFDGFSFWFYGSSSGLTYQVDIMDNRSDPNVDTAERFAYRFDDDFSGWRYISVPWGAFERRTDFQPDGAPNDGLTLTEMWGWAFVLPLDIGTFSLDDVGLVNHVIDDFESGVSPGIDCSGIPLGFCTFRDTSSSVAISSATTPPVPLLPALGSPNAVIQVDLNVAAFAGFIHGFTNETEETWVSQDWSAYEGFAFWLYGHNSGTDLFIDLLENRNPGSTSDDAERWTVTFKDDFSGWQYFAFPFADFVRKDVGNGAPNDGLTLDEVHGWAFGTLGSGGAITFYLDQASLFGQAAERPLEVTFAAADYEVEEGATAEVTVKLTRPLQEDDPDQVSVSYTTEEASAIVDRDYTPVSGTLTFMKGGSSEQAFTIETFDNPKHDGDKRVILRLSDPVDIAPGFLTQASLTILDDDPLDPTLLDDFERFPYQFDTAGNVTLSKLEIPAGDPLALPEQGPFEGVLSVTSPLLVEIDVKPGDDDGNLCNSGEGVIPVAILTTADFQATTVDHTTARLGDASETHVDNKTGQARRHEEDVDHDGDTDLVFHFRFEETGYTCDTTQVTLTGLTFGGQPLIAGGEGGFGRDFPLGEDWRKAEALSFWFYGTNSGDMITVQIKDNRAPDPGPAGWQLVWSDEFDAPAGTPPNPANWTHEIGDGTVNGIPGWGNSELEYYTDSPDNAATDGEGNLVITAREADGSLICYYGPCEYTSARLISWYKAEFAYGRIEARLRVPFGEGLWPAFWSLGTDIGEVGWPQTGEIDIMEFVGRLPTEIFGTIHGPGYSGGDSFGGVYDFGEGVFNDYHTFAIEWEPDEIRWFVDGINYHNATPADITPNEWVFNHPFFLIMNVAVGGNFGGPVGEDTTFPQTLHVDYVRVYQAPDTAERFEASFTDSFSGWQKVVLPFETFTRSAEQPAGAPDDGFDLSEVWGYGFKLPEGGTTSGSLLLDQVRLELIPPPTEITVVNTNDSGDGSLRQAIADVASGGTITFDPGLTGGTITLTSGPLAIGKDLTIDGSAAPGLTISGNNTTRVLIINPGATANINALVITGGLGNAQAGGIRNNGTLNLSNSTVTGNTVAGGAGDFTAGGGGIYNGEGATLNLTDSTVSGNHADNDGGGIYAFFASTTNVIRSTLSGNTAGNVGGGIRMLGNADIVNSTLSSNQSFSWYGGAVFHTDGVMNLLNSTVADNIAPSGAPAELFVGTFTDANATMTLQNTIVADSTGSQAGCFVAPFGSGVVTLASNGHNIGHDSSCNLTSPGDQPDTDPLLGPPADNGGPTLTHALLAGSPAIDAADDAVCPAIDQRGVARPQGAACDIGAYEFEP